MWLSRRVHRTRSTVEVHRIAVGILLFMLLTSCSIRSGIVGTGGFPPPDGRQLARALLDELDVARRALPLPAVRRDPGLDDAARKGLLVIEAGVPEQVAVLDHLNAVAGLPTGQQYGITFEDRTPGVDDRTRAVWRRSSTSEGSDLPLAGDPALDGVGWAAVGPWAVFVVHARPLGPADGPALHAAIDAEVQRVRPGLRRAAPLEAIAGEVVADGVLDDGDTLRYGRAGGVPVHFSSLRSGPHLPTLPVRSVLADESPTLRHRWLAEFAVATKVTDSGTVVLVVLATGEADRNLLADELAAAEARATELVNRARTAAGLPAMLLDPVLAHSAREWVSASSRQGCYVAYDNDRGCPGTTPEGTYWAALHGTWSGADDAFTWLLPPVEPGDEKFRAFGAAAALAPDGTVWSTILLAP